jgi:hypothetical protein
MVNNIVEKFDVVETPTSYPDAPGEADHVAVKESLPTLSAETDDGATGAVRTDDTFEFGDVPPLFTALTR